MATTCSTDPAGMHPLTHQPKLSRGRRDADFWHQHQTFEFPLDMRQDTTDLIRLPEGASWVIVAGSDLLLQCEHATNTRVGRETFFVLAYDGSGNVLGKLAEFHGPTAALQALPSLLTVAPHAPPQPLAHADRRHAHQRHATARRGGDQGVTMNELINEDGEVVVRLTDGWSLRSGARELTSGDYVRLVDPSGNEYAYWDSAEWAEDPVLVMGAIINSAAGLRLKLKEKADG